MSRRLDNVTGFTDNKVWDLFWWLLTSIKAVTSLNREHNSNDPQQEVAEETIQDRPNKAVRLRYPVSWKVKHHSWRYSLKTPFCWCTNFLLICCRAINDILEISNLPITTVAPPGCCCCCWDCCTTLLTTIGPAGCICCWATPAGCWYCCWVPVPGYCCCWL